jgi:endoglucanase
VVTVPSSTACSKPPAELTLSFLGSDRILVHITETEIEEVPPQPVALGAPVEWADDFADRFGGMGTLDGVPGNFSGRRHAIAPQMFRPWPRLKQETVISAFDPPEGEGFGPSAADNPSSWTVTVDGMSRPVEAVWRKTVPFQTAQVAPREYASGRRHLVTLLLGSAIAEGAEVSVALPGLAPSVARRSDALQSEVVHVCGAGYPLTDSKKGYVGLWLGADQLGVPGSTDSALSEGQPWRLVDAATGAVVAEGGLTMAKPATEAHLEDLNFNACDIYEADFSAVSAEGTYRFEVQGIGSSPAFPVTRDPFAEVFRLAARWYYHQRSGCSIEASYGEGRTRPRNGHPEDGLTVWQTEVQLGRTSEGFVGEPSSMALLAQQPAEDMPGAVANPKAWGGWHDAGDWDRRSQHMDVVFQMAQMVEHFAAARELHMNIPESGKAFADPAVHARKGSDDRGDGRTVLPDLIHEALWGISLWRRTQGSDGSIIGGVEYSREGITGSVSWNPVQRAYAYAAEEWAAYQFAMAAAKLGHVISTVCGDTVLGAALIAEAEAAWAWAEAQVEAGSVGQDADAVEAVTRVRIGAAAPLYRAAGTPGAREVFERLNAFAPRDSEAAPKAPRAVIAPVSFDYVLAGREGREIDAGIAQAIIEWSAARVGNDRRLGADYGLHNTDLYAWGLGWFRFGPGSNWRSRLALAHVLATGEAAGVSEIVLEGMWFGLGCNPSNVSFVQGIGARAFADPLVIDLAGLCPVPGQICFGVAGGQLAEFERASIAGALYPADEAWPRYARIFESSRVIRCAEHGMRSNAMEWLLASCMAAQLLRPA